MRNSERFRTSVRLRIQKGQVLLRYSGTPTVVCTLLDLSQGGCRCLLPLSALGREDVEAWRRIIEPDRVLNIEIHFPPYLNDFPLEAELRTVEPIPGGKMEVGLKFLNLDGEQQRVLGQIMVAVAAGKVREAFKPEQASQSARYLVGARTQTAQMADQITPLNAEQCKAISKRSPRTSAGSGPGAKCPSGPTRGGGTAMLNNPFHGKRVGEVLVQMSLLSGKEMEEAVLRSRECKQRLGRYLLQSGLVKPDELCRALALQSGLPVADLSSLDTIAPLGSIFPYSLMAGHQFMPIEDSKDVVCIAVANPLSKGVIGELERLCKKHVEVFLGREDHVLLGLDHLRPVERNHERRFTRFPTTLPVEFQLCNRLGRLHEIRCYVGRTLNVSEGGMQIEGEAPGIGKPDRIHRRGLCMRVSLRIDGREIEMLCDPRFIRVHEEVNAGEEFPWTFGLRILEISREDREHYQQFCSKLEGTSVVQPGP